MIYFIQSGREGPIKVGYTHSEASLARRINTLQVASHEALYLRHTEGGTMGDEQSIHEHLAEWRMRGEWFEPSAVVMEFVETARRNGWRKAMVGHRQEPDWRGLECINWQTDLWNRFRVRANFDTGEVNQIDLDRLYKRRGGHVELPAFPGR